MRYLDSEGKELKIDQTVISEQGVGKLVNLFIADKIPVAQVDYVNASDQHMCKDITGVTFINPFRS